MLIKRREAEEVVEMLWTHFDTDGSGFIEREEAKDLFEFVFMHNKAELDKYSLDEMFKRVDTNNDAKLSKDEVVELLMSTL